MLSQCANPKCSKPFLRLREGKLFLVETSRPGKSNSSRTEAATSARELHPRVERFWLCDTCAGQWTLIYDRNQGVSLIALRKRPASAPSPGGLSQAVSA